MNKTQEMSIMDQSFFKPTPLGPRTAQLNHANKWHAWERYHIPDAYEGVNAELRALHERVVLEDKSPMNWYSITGPDARRFLDYMLPRDLTRLEAGAAMYTPWLDERGKVVVDMPVFQLDEKTCVTMGGHLEKWLRQHIERFTVEIEDISEEFVVMPLQGPSSRAVIEAATGEDWSDVKFMRGRRTQIGGCDLYVWRAGYSSKLGYELHTKSNNAVRIYDAIMEAGKPFGILNIGQNAVQVARTEAGIIVPGIDYARSGPDPNIAAYASTSEEDLVSPFEIGLGQLINLDKPGDFIGKEALLKEKANGGAPRKLVGLKVNWRDIVSLYEAEDLPPEISRRIDYRRHMLQHDGQVVGRATSVCWSPTIQKEIAIGRLKREIAEPGTRLSMEWAEHGTRLIEERLAEVVHGLVGATVVELPFVAKSTKLSW